MESYVSEIVEQLDPNGDRFAAVLTRADCYDLQDGSYSKDLRILGRPLERLVLIDDSPPSFLLQPDNAIPITPYFGQMEDRALPMMLPMLRGLDMLTDVRDTLISTYDVRNGLKSHLQKMRASS